MKYNIIRFLRDKASLKRKEQQESYHFYYAFARATCQDHSSLNGLRELTTFYTTNYGLRKTLKIILFGEEPMIEAFRQRVSELEKENTLSLLKKY